MRTLILVFALLFSLSANAQSQTRTVEGTIAWFTPTGEVEMQTGERYPLARKDATTKSEMAHHSHFSVTVLNHMTDDEPTPLPFGTLLSVGYADKVRLTIDNGVVTAIDILYLEQ